MTVRVLTDSTASLPAAVIEQLGVGVVPITIALGDAALRDGDLPLREVLARVDAGEPVQTSGPTPGDFAVAIERALGHGDGVLVLTVSDQMSSTYQAACLASNMVEGRTRVLDTGTAAGAQGLVVAAAARAAAEGADLDGVEARAKDVAARVRLLATVDRLDRLMASGRVPDLAGRAGNALGVNPLFEFSDGHARPLRPAFSRSAALSRIVDSCRDSQPGAGRLHAAAMHAGAADAAEELLQRATDGFDVAEALLASFSPGMVVHTGEGLAGLAWWWEAPG